ncbi:uncharacterized protein LOC141697967 isoform X5 [Apium graveolens]|uniref:uncharacterized protein LOC141697967 isoform X5 n=1 Tax=Apium graveolens TaxID=4045 RepID=UPI003D7987FA
MIEYAESSKNFVENVGTDSFVESDDACLSVIKQVRTGFVVGNFPDFFEYGKIVSRYVSRVNGGALKVKAFSATSDCYDFVEAAAETKHCRDSSWRRSKSNSPAPTIPIKV